MLLKTETAELSALAWTVLRKKKLAKKNNDYFIHLSLRKQSRYPPINIEILLSNPATTQATSAKYHKLKR